MEAEIEEQEVIDEIESNFEEQIDEDLNWTLDIILNEIDQRLYQKHINRETKNMVMLGLESALKDTINLYFLGETFKFNCIPTDLKLENDVPLKPIPKDTLQF